MLLFALPIVLCAVLAQTQLRQFVGPESGSFVDLKQGDECFLRRGDVELLIRQGDVEHVL